MVYKMLNFYFVLGRHLISGVTEKLRKFLVSTILHMQCFSTETRNFKCIAHSAGTEWLLLLRKVVCLLYLS